MSPPPTATANIRGVCRMFAVVPWMPSRPFAVSEDAGSWLVCFATDDSFQLVWWPFSSCSPRSRPTSYLPLLSIAGLHQSTDTRNPVKQSRQSMTIFSSYSIYAGCELQKGDLRHSSYSRNPRPLRPLSPHSTISGSDAHCICFR